ncbi:MAG: 50S ribosomal protein L31 [Anaerolineales bacterium]|nr:50S ribosomal protein L31 [Anaerolineales bacterium]
MKADIHPKYYPDARVTCSCGASWTTGSTVPEIRTDVCSTCHPFYTGEQRIIDTAGQVERFMKRLERRQSESARRGLEMQMRQEADEAARKARARWQRRSRGAEVCKVRARRATERRAKLSLGSDRNIRAETLDLCPFLLRRVSHRSANVLCAR